MGTKTTGKPSREKTDQPETSRFYRFRTGFTNLVKRWSLLILALLIVLVVFDMGFAVWETSYNPEFCNVCHIIRPYVTSYQTSDNLDGMHRDANVSCKECHIVKPIDTIGELTSYIKGDYETPMETHKFESKDCLTCHRSYENLASKTADFQVDGELVNPHEYRVDTSLKNPHESDEGQVECSYCHHSHTESPGISYCYSCHHTEELVGCGGGECHDEGDLASGG